MCHLFFCVTKLSSNEVIPLYSNPCLCTEAVSTGARTWGRGRCRCCAPWCTPASSSSRGGRPRPSTRAGSTPSTPSRSGCTSMRPPEMLQRGRWTRDTWRHVHPGHNFMSIETTSTSNHPITSYDHDIWYLSFIHQNLAEISMHSVLHVFVLNINAHMNRFPIFWSLKLMEDLNICLCTFNVVLIYLHI